MDEPLTAEEETEHWRVRALGNAETLVALDADLARLHAVIREAAEELDAMSTQGLPVSGIADDLRSAVESRALPDGAE